MTHPSVSDQLETFNIRAIALDVVDERVPREVMIVRELILLQTDDVVQSVDYELL